VRAKIWNRKKRHESKIPESGCFDLGASNVCALTLKGESLWRCQKKKNVVGDSLDGKVNQREKERHRRERETQAKETRSGLPMEIYCEEIPKFYLVELRPRSQH